MPEYATKEKKIEIKSAKQLQLLIKALELAYRKAEPADKKVYSRILKKLER